MVQSIICFVDLTDVTLVDEETNSVATADAKRAIPGKLSQMPQTFLNFLTVLSFMGKRNLLEKWCTAFVLPQ